MEKGLTVALYEPEIPTNVGTIARTCACLDISLILIEPLGFILEDRSFKRSKLDYEAQISISPSFNDFLAKFENSRKILFAPHMSLTLDEVEILPGDVFLFGRESSGVENFVADKCDLIVSLPMSTKARSLNLAMSVSMAVYQGQKQIRTNKKNQNNLSAI